MADKKDDKKDPKKDNTVLGGIVTGSTWALSTFLFLCLFFIVCPHLSDIWGGVTGFFKSGSQQAQAAPITSSPTPDYSTNQEPREKVIWIGAEAQPTTTRVTLNRHEWSERIEFFPGANSEAWIIPPKDGEVEILDESLDLVLRLRWEDLRSGNDVPLGVLLSFRLRGEGVATVQTRPMQRTPRR